MKVFNMGTERNKLDELKGRQPFRVPDGYFEGLTEDIMSRLPEHPVVKSKKISMYDRVKPLLYMAAMFIGAILILNILGKNNQPDQKGDSNATTVVSSRDALSEDDEFMDYMAEMYADKFAYSYLDDYMEVGNK